VKIIELFGIYHSESIDRQILLRL